MGLLSGRKNANANTTTMGRTKHGMGTTNGGVSNHRYETRSRGGLFSRNNAPGTAATTTNSAGLGSTGSGFGTKHSRNNVGTTGSTGMTSGMTSGGYSGQGVNNQGAPTHGHAHSTITKGKIENKVGKVFGSTNMRMKGAAKIEQGEAEKVAAGHLNDADRLENAAVQKRHMAGVGPGIHSTAGNVRGGLKH